MSKPGRKGGGGQATNPGGGSARTRAVASIIRLINQIQRNAGSLVVREQIDDQWANVPLIELPTHLAIQHLCKILRDNLQLASTPDGSAAKRRSLKVR